MRLMTVRKIALSVVVCASFAASSAFAMEDLRSGQGSDDFLFEAFGAEAVTGDDVLSAESGREALDIGTIDLDLELTQSTNSNRQAANNQNNLVIDSPTGNGIISDGSFSNSLFGQAVVVTGNNNNVQVNEAVIFNMY